MSDTKTVYVQREIAEWRRETWAVEIPADTPADGAEGTAMDAMCGGGAEIVADEGVAYVNHMDAEWLGLVDYAPRVPAR